MDSDMWNKEYRDVKSIPSSDRPGSSRAFRMGMSIADSRFDRVLFLGCGNGRNIFAVESKQCIGVDFSEEAVERARKMTKSRSSDSIHIVEADVEEWLDECEEEFDLIVDSYFSCHFKPDRFKNLQSRIESVCADNALYFWSGIGSEDEFYNQVAEKVDYPFVKDPNNEIIKRLYSLDELNNGIIEFERIALNSLYFDDSVNGEEYEREVLWGLYRVRKTD